MDQEKPTQTPGEQTRDAMKLLRDHYGTKIAWGKHIAVKLALRSSTTNSRLVRMEMERLGLLGKQLSREYWLGAVFRELSREKVLVKTGNRFKYSDPERNIHEREIHEWQLNESADLTEYRQPPKET